VELVVHVFYVFLPTGSAVQTLVALFARRAGGVTVGDSRSENPKAFSYKSRGLAVDHKGREPNN